MPKLPTVTANKTIKVLEKIGFQKIRQKGKHPMAILGALMRKLLHIAYGVIKTGKPFDPNYAQIA